MTPLNDLELVVKMLEQTNSKLDRIENRQDQYHETFVTRNEFTSTNERLVDDITNLVKEFKQIAETLTTNKVEQNEITNRIQQIEKRLDEKDNHKRNMWIAIIGSLSLAIFEFINSHILK